MNSTKYGVDIAKNVFQLYWVEPETGEVLRPDDTSPVTLKKCWFKPA